MKQSRFFLICISFLILLAFGYFYSGKNLAFRFVDEEYDFTIGKYLTKNEKLYDDLITNHQPLNPIIGSQIQQFLSPNSTYQLISKHRQFLIVWATFWSLVLIYYFGMGALAFVVLYELTKIHLLGNLFLSESLIVYPLVALSGLTLFLKRKLTYPELFFWGICFSLSFFLLSPVAPLLIFLLFLTLKKQKDELSKSIIFMLIGILVVFLFVLKYISLPGYLHFVFLINLNYTIPAFHSEPWPITILKSFLTPILSFLPQPSTPTLWVIRILFLQFIFNFFTEEKRNLKKILTLILVLGLANLRFVKPGTEGYSGFHILPWYAVFIFICCMSAFTFDLNQVNIKKSIFKFALIFLAFFLSLNFAKTSLFSKNNSQADYYINYSTHTSFGEAIKIMKVSKDTLFVSPDAWLIYWQSDTSHIPKLFGDYAWMAGIPSLHNQIIEIFEKTPPTFFYCENCRNLDLEKYLTKYQELKKDEGKTNLYVLTKKIKELTEEQKEKLDYYKYNF